MRILLVCAFLALAGCARTPVVDSATPRSISLRFDPWYVSGPMATAEAQTHCQKYGKNAELIERYKSGLWGYMNFRCVD